MAFDEGDILSIVSNGFFQETAAGSTTVTSISPTSGGYWTLLTINGSNFGSVQGNGTALVGTRPLEAISWSDTQIKGRVDYGQLSGAKTVAVVSNTGSTDTFDSFTINSSGAKTARTKVREAVKYQVGRITTAKGFRTNVRAVYDPPRNMGDMNHLPCVNLLWGTEDRAGDYILGNNSLLDIVLQARMDVFFNDINDPETAKDKIIADTQQLFGQNYYITGEDGKRTAFNCVYETCTPWGTEIQRPNCGVSIMFNVYYRIKLTDPDTIA